MLQKSSRERNWTILTSQGLKKSLGGGGGDLRKGVSDWLYLTSVPTAWSGEGRSFNLTIPQRVGKENWDTVSRERNNRCWPRNVREIAKIKHHSFQGPSFAQDCGKEESKRNLYHRVSDLPCRCSTRKLGWGGPVTSNHGYSLVHNVSASAICPEFLVTAMRS